MRENGHQGLRRLTALFAAICTLGALAIVPSTANASETKSSDTSAVTSSRTFAKKASKAKTTKSKSTKAVAAAKTYDISEVGSVAIDKITNAKGVEYNGVRSDGSKVTDGVDGSSIDRKSVV